jgi:hypothetical protein
LGEIKINVSAIEVVDFTQFKGYWTDTTITDKTEVILMSKGKLELFFHYQGTKITDTPKLKSVVNTYNKYGLYTYKNKILIGFQTK